MNTADYNLAPFLFFFQTLDGKVHFVYKKVAMVEQFFDIIYSVHVEAAGDTQLRGRAGKHCGQKRTYRAVSQRIINTVAQGAKRSRVRGSNPVRYSLLLQTNRIAVPLAARNSGRMLMAKLRESEHILLERFSDCGFKIRKMVISF